MACITSKAPISLNVSAVLATAKITHTVYLQDLTQAVFEDSNSSNNINIQMVSVTTEGPT